MGGRSIRMGVDKAMLDWDGTPLWRHQLGTLRALEPDEIFISIGNRTDFDPGAEVVGLVRDAPAAKGPMAGIAGALAAMDCDQLVVLAVDLPEMTSTHLGGLLAAAADGIGRVVERGGYFEGLAAVYGKDLAGLAAEVAAGSDPSVQHFVRRAVGIGAVKVESAEPEDEFCFRNLNAPGD